VVSIRRRLTLVLLAGFTVIVVLGGFVLARQLGRGVADEYDAALLARARGLAGLVEREHGAIEMDFLAGVMPEYERGEHPDYFQVWLEEGEVFRRSARLEGNLPRVQETLGKPRFIDLPLPDGHRGRMVQVTFEPRGVGPPRIVTLAVATSRERLDDLLARMRFTILGVGLFAALLAGLLIRRALRAGLQPVDEVATAVERLDAESLGDRIVLERTPRELAPVVEQLNALLDRLEASFERERRFAANVAHELRTPISELRALAEVGGKWPGDEASARRYFEDARGIAARMERLVVDLLLLARCQSGVETVRVGRVDLREIVEGAWSELAPGAGGRELRLELPAEPIAESDPDKLRIILRNLLENAISYSPEGAAIPCVASRREGRLALVLTNPAERLDPGDLERLTEPFWRKDESRSSTEHAGLGLSLVEVLAALLRLELRLEQDPDGTFRVTLGGFAEPSAVSRQPPAGGGGADRGAGG
jgi:two-component system sensor histidine kinase QseC